MISELLEKSFMKKNRQHPFHTVKFMRQARNEMSNEFLQDKQQYLANLQEAMKDFKAKQGKAVIHSL